MPNVIIPPEQFAKEVMGLLRENGLLDPPNPKDALIYNKALELFSLDEGTEPWACEFEFEELEYSVYSFYISRAKNLIG